MVFRPTAIQGFGALTWSLLMSAVSLRSRRRVFSRICADSLRLSACESTQRYQGKFHTGINQGKFHTRSLS